MSTEPAQQYLYGTDGAEHLHFEIEDACDRSASLRTDTFTICEYTVHPPFHHLPNVQIVAEWIGEHAGEETDEYFYEEACDALADPEVHALLTAALNLAASKITYRMADTIVASYQVTVNAEGWTIGERIPSGGPQ